MNDFVNGQNVVDGIIEEENMRKLAARIAQQHGRLCHEIAVLHVMNGWYSVQFADGVRVIGKIRELGK